MFQDNWVRFGFGKDFKSISMTEPFVIDYSGAKQHPSLSSGLDIAHETCWRIYESMPKPLTLMVSGGVDSQAMAYAFKTSGVPDIRYVWARYNDGLNDHDFETGHFYTDHGIDVEVMPFDIIRFHEEDLFEWAVRYQNNSPHILTHCKIASTITEGTVVSSGSVMTRNGMGGMSYSVFGLERYAQISGQPVIGFFFSYSPELVHCVRDFSTSLPAYDHKCAAYQSMGLPVVPQVKKLHGFERLKEMYDGATVPAKDRVRFANQPSKRPYDLKFRYPLVDLVPYSQDSQTIF